MRCPECNSELEDMFCTNCEKEIINIYFNRIEEAQVERNYEKALQEIDELEKIVTDQKVYNKIEDLRGNIQINLMNYSPSKKKLKLNYKKLVLSIFIVGALIIGVQYFAKTILIKDNKKELMMVVNLNEPISPAADINSKVFYEEFFKTISKYSDFHYYLNISGTTLKSLNWYKNDLNDIIYEGIKSDRYSLLGSTYSQNIIYSLPNWVNQITINEHKKILKSMFESEPKGFHNPGSVWNDAISEIIINNGYEFSFVEGETNEIIQYKGLNLIQYSLESLSTLDKYLLGEISLESMVQDILSDKILSLNIDLDKILNFAGYNVAHFQEILHRIDLLLSEIDLKEDIEITKYEEIIKDSSIREVQNLSFRVSSRLENDAFSLGYNSWMDYNYNSDVILKFREFIKNIDSEDYSSYIYELMIKNIIFHTYNFGQVFPDRISSGEKTEKKYAFNFNIYNFNIYKEVSKYLKARENKIYIKDINLNGTDEILVVNGYNFYIFSKLLGGRLIFWHNLDSNIQIMGGNNSSQVSEIYTNADMFIEPFFFHENRYCVRNKALNEIIQIHKKDIPMYNRYFEAKILEKGLHFENAYYIKKINFLENGLEVNYKLKTEIEKIKIISEFQPNYLSVLDLSIDGIEMYKDYEMIILENLNTGDKVIVEGDYLDAESYNSLFGKLVYVESDKDEFQHIIKFEIGGKND